MRWPALDGALVDAVVTTRHGGVSTGPYASLNLGLHVGDDPEAVVENRRRAARAVGLQLDDLVFCEQAHGHEVADVGADDRGRGAYTQGDALPGVDGLVTRDPDVGLVIMVADCTPVVLFDPRTVALACVHAGWRGTVARAVGAAVDRLVTGGARPGDIVAAIGPCIDRTRYQVGAEVADQASAAFPDAVEPDREGKWRFDLWRANRQVLEDAGVPRANITLAGLPTGPGTPFFSDRDLRPCGRFALIARLKRAPG